MYLTDMISIGLIEDDKEIRNSLGEFLSKQSDILLEASTESVEEFLELDPKELNLDILLLDIELPGISGIAGIRFIKEKYPKIEIIMLTIYEDFDKIFNALKAGASGYLLKTATFEKIKYAIEETYKGGAMMSPIIARHIIEHFKKGKIAGGESGLTKRERQVVAYLLDGFTYNKIASTLGMSVNTVRFHIKNIYNKLHISSRAELMSKEFNK